MVFGAIECSPFLLFIVKSGEARWKALEDVTVAKLPAAEKYLQSDLFALQ